ncbi:stage 0 sporulation protein [Candidatus Sumerlaeota bacterium]|nr:stage 0 sporulation protein [Candidatus Sumerlaeota bacterium]
MPKYFQTEDASLKTGDFCVCGFDDREETGLVASLETRSEISIKTGHYPKILRKAEPEEIEKWKELKKREDKAILLFRQKSIQHNLVLKVVDVRFDDKNNKTVFHFTSDKRVDFRELVRDLASILHTRIELWQIGVRDEARQVDGYGICGQRLCCAGFIREFQPVTIKLAKNQDIFLSPAKLSGCCGRLMCCLAYEDELYKELAKSAAPIGAFVRAKNIQGIVIERNLLNQTYVVQDDNENKSQVKQSQIIEMKPPEKPVPVVIPEDEDSSEDIPPDDEEPRE